ncbi:MAG: acyl-CoA hydrolase [Cellvibrionaceae bacterium]|jgi:acyl-CoA hydrolase
MKSKTVAQSKITLAQVMGPTDANTLGNVHGGIIMKICDEAGAMAAVRHAGRPVVTVTVDSMRFHSPVHVGNLMFVDACVTWIGRTSIETRVTVRAENVATGKTTHTNTAYFVYVALGEDGRPMEVPRITPETAEEISAYEKGELRRKLRLQLAEAN